ncbi:MAG: DMT family transporter [Prolixibacteraceae bacterium]|nr:DMT family transporter [Prolixibacteraceae bacterium]
MKTDTFKGYTYALVATIAYSNVYIFSKAALNEIHLVMFGMIWYAIGALLALLFAFQNKKLRQLRFLTRKQVLILVTLGFLEMLTTTLFFLSIHIIPDPSVTSFLGNMFPVMVTLGGVFILYEKFGIIESVGALIALGGAFIISYNGGTTLKTFFIEGTGVVFLNAIFATIATLVVKVHVKKLSPELLNLNRSTWLFAFSLVMFFILDIDFKIPGNVLENIGIGSFLEFLTILTVYYSYHYIEASRSAIVQSLKGIFVLIVAFLFFKTLPLTHQLIGGILSVMGVLIMTMAQAGIFRKRKPLASVN